MKPNCFPDEYQYIQWMDADKRAKSIGDERYIPFPCISCTPTYSMKMRMESKCDHPDTRFRYDEKEGEFIGYDPKLLSHNTGPRAKKRTGCSSQYKGVSWVKSRELWCARIYKDKIQTILGYFEHEEEAGRAYQAAAKLFGLIA